MQKLYKICHQNAKVIQNFCRNKLNNYLRKKFAKYLDNLAKKYLTHLINNIAKVNELNNTLRRKPFYDFLDNLYDKGRYNKIKDIFIKLLPKQKQINWIQRKMMLLRKYNRYIKATILENYLIMIN